MRQLFYLLMIVLLQSFLTSCEREFDIAVKPNKAMLVVEGYINNEMPKYNYVVLSRSQDYYSTRLENLPVTGAKVTITEGTPQDDSIVWDKDNAVVLKERNITAMNISSRSISGGIYFDERLITDTTNALLGKPGKYYLLTIETDGKVYSSLTFLPPPVRLDSLSSENHFIETKNNNEERAMVTLYYKDPDTLGNAQLVYSRSDDNRNYFGWGGLRASRYINGADDFVNGEYLKSTISFDFAINEKVDYYFISVERKVYNFWNSFTKAKDNAGPFSTPVMLDNTIEGDNDVVGCFSGFSVSSKSIVVR